MMRLCQWKQLCFILPGLFIGYNSSNISPWYMFCIQIRFFFLSEEIPRVKGALLSQYKCFRHILIQKTNTQRDCLVLSEWKSFICSRDYTDWKWKCLVEKNSTPQWIALKCVNVCANPSLMPISPLFYDFLCPPPLTPLPLAATALPVSVALRSYHTSSDFIWPSPANQRPTSGWFPWQPTGPNILGLKRWVEVWLVGGGCGGEGVGNEKCPEIDSSDGQSRTVAWMALHCHCFFYVCVWVCMCYLISPESTAHPMDPVGKGGVEGCLFVSRCMCEGERVQGYRWSYFLTEPKSSSNTGYSL